MNTNGRSKRGRPGTEANTPVYQHVRVCKEKSGKGPGSVSIHFLSTITSQNFEEPIRLQNETTRNVIPSHAHKAKGADYAIW